MVLRCVHAVNLNRRRIPRIHGTSGLDTPVSVSGATPTERSRTHPAREVGHHHSSAPRMLEITTNIAASPESRTARARAKLITNDTHTRNWTLSQRHDVIIISFSSPARPTPTRTGWRAHETPPPPTRNHYAERHARGPQDQPRHQRGGDCRAGCRMDPSGRSGLLGTPRRHGRAQTQGPC